MTEIKTLEECKNLIATKCNYIHWKELIQHNEPGTIEYNFWPQVVELYASEKTKGMFTESQVREACQALEQANKAHLATISKLKRELQDYRDDKSDGTNSYFVDEDLGPRSGWSV